MQVNLTLTPGYRLKISRASRMSELVDRTKTDNYIDVVPGRPAYNPGIWDSFRGPQKAPNTNHNVFTRVTLNQGTRSTFDAMWAIRKMNGAGFWLCGRADGPRGGAGRKGARFGGAAIRG